jgi:hypothetical protein
MDPIYDISNGHLDEEEWGLDSQRVWLCPLVKSMRNRMPDESAGFEMRER